MLPLLLPLLLLLLPLWNITIKNAVRTEAADRAPASAAVWMSAVLKRRRRQVCFCLCLLL